MNEFIITARTATSVAKFIWIAPSSADAAEHVASLAAVQARILDSAADRLKPGGQLVYCVCSLEPEEGEAQVEAFLARRKDMTLAPIAPGEGGAPEASLTARGTLRLLPHQREGGQDGFFAARFRKA